MTSTYNATGIVLDKYIDISNNMESTIKGDLGDSINLDKDSFIGHIKNIVATTEATANEILQGVYDAGSVENSSGVTLAGNVGMVGVRRVGYSYSTISEVELTSSKPCVVPVGSRYRTASNVVFETDTELVFTSATSETVSATCVTAGNIEVGIGELNIIASAINGISSVTNLGAAVVGRERQTDVELKDTHTLVVATSGGGDSADIYNSLFNDAGVSAALIRENDTDDIVDSLPAHTIRVVVIGGDDDVIADAVWVNKTSTVATYGLVSGVAHSQTTGQTKIINFDRGELVPVYIALNITKMTAFPVGGESTIKEAFALLDEEWGLSDNVDFNSLFGAAYAVEGIKVNSITVGLSAAPLSSVDIDMSDVQLPTLDVERDDITNNISAINVEIVTS